MAASRSTRVTRSSVGINGLDDNFCGRTLRNRSIAHPEDSSPNPPQRARSPKKKQDCQQPPSKGTTSSRLADSKQPQGSRESWMSPRKRGLSSSEKDSNPDKADNCDRRPSREVSPVLKRIKRCPRSGDAPSSEEESPVKPEKPAGDSKEAERDEDSPGPKRARRCLLLDDYDKGEIKKVDSPTGKNSLPVFSDEAGQVTNGLDEQDLDDGKNCTEDASKPHRAGSCEPAEDIGAVPASTRNKSLSLLNGSKADSALDPDDVPCTNSHSEQAEPSAPTAPTTTAGSSAAVENERAHPRPVAASSPEELPAGKEPEEEVDVVGDGGGGSARECGVENTNGGLCAVQDNKPTSGEPEPPVGLDGSPAEAASFTEPQEHRYTLRTSPRRAACSRGSPHKLNSPSRDSGLAKEEEKEGTENRNLPSGEAKSDSEPGAKPDPAPCDGQGPPGEHGDVTVKLTGESGLSDSRLSRSAKELVSSHATEEDEDEEDPDVYYFESDHLALKHSKDYQRLLQTIAVLEAQRTQAILDLECLARRQKEALSNPVGFVEQLQKQVSVGLPCPQRVVQLPEIAWDQYTSGLGDFQKEFRNKKRNTRRLKLIFDKVGLPARPKSPLDSKKEAESSALYSALPSSDGPDLASGSRTQMIRGRVCDQSKPDTFNQLWTVEEQKKLEQLLLKFPPEEVESKRWQKIADELGNRTAKQVASRVQKYFIKLTKAGIPVPGRTPNLCMYSKKASNKRQHHLNKHLYRPSTFMTSYEPPVYMDDDDDRSSFYSNLQDAAAEESDEESIPVEYRHLPEYKELMQLKKLKKQKLHEMCAENSLVQHIGFKCDNCGVEPIQGVRWHCQDCSPENAIDFCTSCSDCLLKTETHKPDHTLEAIYRAETFLDRDYCMPHSTGYNYLDPNYFPANR